MLARLIFAAAEETQTLVGNIQSHGFFKPWDVFGAHANRQGERASRAGATLEFAPVAIAVGDWARGNFKAESSGRHMSSIRILCGVGRGGFFPICGAHLFIAIRGANNSGEDFGLAERNAGIVGEGNPQRHARRVGFVAGNKHTTARNVQGVANFGLLAEGCRPAKSGGNPELDAMMLASVHKPPTVRLRQAGGNSQYI